MGDHVCPKVPQGLGSSLDPSSVFAEREAQRLEWGRVLIGERRRVRMTSPLAGAVDLVPDPRGFALLHERAMPQKDQLCGAFWGALALAAAGYAVDQDEVAIRAGTTLAEGNPAQWLPPGASPRADYGASLPIAADEAYSGTSARSEEHTSELQSRQYLV